VREKQDEKKKTMCALHGGGGVFSTRYVAYPAIRSNASKTAPVQNAQLTILFLVKKYNQKISSAVFKVGFEFI